MNGFKALALPILVATTLIVTPLLGAPTANAQKNTRELKGIITYYGREWRGEELVPYSLKLRKPTKFAAEGCDAQEMDSIDLWDARESPYKGFIGRHVVVVGILDCPRGSIVLKKFSIALDDAPTGLVSNLDVVRHFYDALMQGDGSAASSFVIGEKRERGPLSARQLTEFYSGLSSPITLKDASESDNGTVSVKYKYEAANGHLCNGSADVYLVVRNTAPLIARIDSHGGC